MVLNMYKPRKGMQFGGEMFYQDIFFNIVIKLVSKLELEQQLDVNQYSNSSIWPCSNSTVKQPK